MTAAPPRDRQQRIRDTLAEHATDVWVATASDAGRGPDGFHRSGR